MYVWVDKMVEEGWNLFLQYPLKTAEEIAMEVAENNGFEKNEFYVKNLTWVLKGWMEL